MVMKIVPQNPHPQTMATLKARKFAAHARSHRLHLQRMAACIERVWALQGVVGQRQPGQAAGHRAEVVNAVHKRISAATRQAAKCRL